MKIRKCADAACGVPLVACTATVVPPGKQRHGGRGLCTRCYGRHLKAGTTIDFERNTWPREELYEEWLRLRETGVSRAAAAKRLGVTPDALGLAIRRTERDGGRGRQRAA